LSFSSFLFSLTPLESVVVIIFSYLFHSYFTYSFHLLHLPNFCKAQRFTATIFQVHLSFGQAQRFGAPIFHIRLGFCQAQRFGAVMFQIRLFFHQAQRFGAVNFKSA
jgi:hypothetical protein